MDPVREQLAAYNERDLERFLACYAADTVIEDGQGQVLMEGVAQMRERYGRLFAASPDLHCQIRNHMAVGSYQIDEEYITGLNNGQDIVEVDAIVIYRVEDGQIVHVRMLS